MSEKYTGKHGTENRFDDYVFIPIILINILIWPAIIADWLTGSVIIIAAAALLGLLIDIWFVRLNLRIRRELNQKNNTQTDNQ